MGKTGYTIAFAVLMGFTCGAAFSADWQHVSNMITARDQFAGCLIGNEIVVFGGNGNPDGVNLRIGEKYNINTGIGSAIAPNPHISQGWGVEEVSGVAEDGKFYVFGAWGGIGSSGYYGTINFNEAYDPATNTWTTLAQKPTAVSAASIAVYNDEIFLFGGGYEDEGPSGGPFSYAKVEAYHPTTNTWRYVTDMPKILTGSAIVVEGDAAYVIGGYDMTAGAMNTEVMAYHFTSATWTRNYCSASADAARVYSYASKTPVVVGKAYLLGGIEGTQAYSWPSDKFTVFDIAAKTFEPQNPLPAARSGHLVVTYGNIPYIVGGFSDDEDLNRADSGVYALTADVDLSGEYWFGSLSADVTTNVPWGKRGTVTVTGSNWNQQWDDNDGHHTFSSSFNTLVNLDGSIEIIFPTKTYNVAWNGNAMIHADKAANADNRLGIDLMVRKPAEIQSSDIPGQYSNFGHWLGWNSRWDEAGWGDLAFYANGTANWNMTYDSGESDSGALNWSLDASEPQINIDGSSNPVLVGEDGIAFVADPVPDGGQDFALNFFVKKAASSLTLNDIAGSYQVRFLETAPGGVPYTCGQGTCVIGTDGSFSVDAYYSDGEHDVFSTTCSIGAGNAFFIDGNEFGIVNPAGNLIFLPEYRYEDSSNRTEYDWLGGLFLIRNADTTVAAPSGRFFWQAVKSVFLSGQEGYALTLRVMMSDIKACALKGPNMADYTQAVWDVGRQNWKWEVLPLTLAELQQMSLGTWYMTITHQDDSQSVYAFTITGDLHDSEFPPYAPITEPAQGSSNVIAEHYTLRWVPDGDPFSAHRLLLEIGGNGFNYFTGLADRSTTEWNPGWLEKGTAYTKVGYVNYRFDMITQPSRLSGPAVDWEVFTASLVSGSKNYFTVKYSLDLNEDDRIDLSDLALFASNWLQPSPNEANFDDEARVSLGDFSIFAQHWLEGNRISDHVFKIEMDFGYAYETPDNEDDNTYDFYLCVYTDDTVNKVEFLTPAGNTFEISGNTWTETENSIIETGVDYDEETGWYEWYYEPCFDNIASFDAFGDGLYTITVFYDNGTSRQTTAWFGIPGTADPLPQPTQEPVFTSITNGGTLSSPVTVTWQACTDANANLIYFGTDSNNGQDTELFLETDTTGLDETLSLAPGQWEMELSFAHYYYRTENSDGIMLEVAKYSESDYFISIE